MGRPSVPPISRDTSGWPTSSSRGAPTSAPCSPRAWRASRKGSTASSRPATLPSAWSRSASTPCTTRRRPWQPTRTTITRVLTGSSSPAPVTPSPRSCATASGWRSRTRGRPRHRSHTATASFWWTRSSGSGATTTATTRLISPAWSRTPPDCGPNRRPESPSTVSARAAASASHRALVEGRDEVLEAEPEAPGMPEEQDRREQHDRHREEQLLRQRQADQLVEQDDAAQTEGSRQGVVHVHRADEVSLLAFVHETARGAALPHREPAVVEPPVSAARAPEPQCTREHGTRPRSLQWNRPSHPAATRSGLRRLVERWQHGRPGRVDCGLGSAGEQL